jgi:hypothetical protein
LYGSITVIDTSFSSLSTDPHTTSAIERSCHKLLNETKKHNPPSKLNGRSLTIALNDFNGLFGSLCFVLRFGDDEVIGLPNDVVEWHELSIADRYTAGQ